MPERRKTRPLSASRQRRQRNRRSSLNTDSRPIIETIFDPHPSAPETPVFFSGLDLRSTKEKIDDLENKIKESNNDDSTPEEYLDSLVLMQLYTSLEYGEISIQNARAYLNLSKFYFDQKNLLFQAKSHILNARQILEKLHIKPVDNNLTENLLGFEVYLLLIKYSVYAKQYSSQRDIKMKNKHILSIETKHIDHDLYLIKEYLEKFKHLMNSNDHMEKYMEYILIKFDIIITNLKDFNHDIYELINEIIECIEKHPSNDKIKRKIDIYLRCGFYFVNDVDHIQEGFNYYKKAVELAEEEEKNEPSDLHKQQLANSIFQWGKARVRADRLSGNTERKFKRAIDLYKETNNQADKNVIKISDELATFYTKIKEYQHALNELCDSLSDKKQLFGDFSEEVIQAESRIGAIYLREGDSINAAKHLKECLDLQEFVYGPKDPRTCQTRDAIDIITKDPSVSRAFFSRTQDGIRHDRPAFRLSNKVSYEKEDHELLLTVTKKPPISSRS